jgi:hypothetical protein
LPPTNRFFIGILHQVQSLSGSSAADEDASCGLGNEEDMRNILSEQKETCQPLENFNETFPASCPKAARLAA